MKDKEARERIDRLELLLVGKPFMDLVDRGESVINELRGVLIKSCPKCKHPVLAQSLGTDMVHMWVGCRMPDTVYQCLTCGSKFTCSEKCVCELLEE